MKLPSFIFLVVYSLMLITSGCATYHDQKKFDLLDEITDQYERAMRWGHYELARTFLKEQNDHHRQSHVKRLKKTRITSYKILGRKVSDDKTEAEQEVEIQYYHIDRLIEKSVIDNQVWKYNADKKIWQLHSGFPLFP